MNVIEQYNQKKAELLQIAKMPHENITCVWFNAAINALCLTSPLALGITLSQFKELSERNIEDLSLMDFAILSNNLESKSASDLRMCVPAYVELLTEGEKAVNTWRGIVAQLENEIKTSLAAAAKIQKEKNNVVGGFVKIPGEA